MTESQILANLKALGAKDVTSKAQERNGTTCFTLPTGDCISEHKTGYIRRNLLNLRGKIHTCYQLNPTYKVPYKTVWSDGTYMEWTHNKRMLIHNRTERLRRLLLYSIKQINQSKV
tara:strand:+ start:178 stop:525 length:348 start_codon:yes stop_codon:yes gene_type:complete